MTKATAANKKIGKFLGYSMLGMLLLSCLLAVSLEKHNLLLVLVPTLFVVLDIVIFAKNRERIKQLDEEGERDGPKEGILYSANIKLLGMGIGLASLAFLLIEAFRNLRFLRPALDNAFALTEVGDSVVVKLPSGSVFFLCMIVVFIGFLCFLSFWIILRSMKDD
jgi:hypothetical protein